MRGFHSRHPPAPRRRQITCIQSTFHGVCPILRVHVIAGVPFPYPEGHPWESSWQQRVGVIVKLQRHMHVATVQPAAELISLNPDPGGSRSPAATLMHGSARPLHCSTHSSKRPRHRSAACVLFTHQLLLVAVCSSHTACTHQGRSEQVNAPWYTSALIFLPACPSIGLLTACRARVSLLPCSLAFQAFNSGSLLGKAGALILDRFLTSILPSWLLAAHRRNTA